MFHESNVIYTYDGSYDGVLCCVFHAFEKKERPLAILPEETLQPTLCEVIPIETDLHRANRVAAVLEPKISRRAAETVQALYLCAVRDKELLMLDFIRLGLETGRSVTTMLGNETVAAVAQAVKHLYKEAQNYKGFLRFSVSEKAMTAVIEPKNFVLPLLREHFCARYRNETFLIYDKTHGVALVYAKGEARIFGLTSLDLPPPSAEELNIQSLYRRFFKTIAIESRTNPRCQMSHMPKRYWGEMLETQPEKPTAFAHELTKSLPES